VSLRIPQNQITALRVENGASALDAEQAVELYRIPGAVLARLGAAE
jgi:hypothetical protein